MYFLFVRFVPRRRRQHFMQCGCAFDATIICRRLLSLLHEQCIVFHFLLCRMFSAYFLRFSAVPIFSFLFGAIREFIFESTINAAKRVSVYLYKKQENYLKIMDYHYIVVQYNSIISSLKPRSQIHSVYPVPRKAQSSQNDNHFKKAI